MPKKQKKAPLPVKEKSAKAEKRSFLRLPKAKQLTAFKRPLFTLQPILPHLLVIAVCIGLYYTMIHFYLFFEWGFFIYYAIKLVIAYEILIASVRSLLPPIGALFLGLAVLLFTNCNFLNTLMDADTAWQLAAIGLAGILIALFLELRSRNLK